jgi:hypothetical protein
VREVVTYAAAQDHATACESRVGDLLYHFELSSTSDVHLYANTDDGFGAPTLSLRGAGCDSLSDEITCRERLSQAHLFARALDPGMYYVLVGAGAPIQTSLLLEVDEPSTPPLTDVCDAAPELLPGVSSSLAMVEHSDSIEAGCLVGAVDGAQALVLAQASDVLLLQNFAASDETAISLVTSACGSEAVLACQSGELSPLRVVAEAMPEGDYRIVSESRMANSVRVTAFAREAAGQTLVAFSNHCGEVLAVPETGGRFVGNTATATANYAASCDFALAAAPGAPEQLLQMTLTDNRRVILDMRGSEYETLLTVRAGNECPGSEVAMACSPQLGVRPSYLDLSLNAGTYYLQIDGYDGASGPWQLDIFTAPL